MSRPSRRGRLDQSELAGNWLTQLRGWLDDAVADAALEPNAMVLATAGADGRPGARTVLLKGLDERGLVFYTNLASRKGRELGENPRASLVFLWPSLQRQVVVDGRVEPVSAAEADAYFAARPRGSRLAALVSPQSAVIDSRGELERRHAQAGEGLADPPRPRWWGGLRVAPDSVEFWHGREDRLHDRLRYRDTGGGWVVERLAP